MKRPKGMQGGFGRADLGGDLRDRLQTRAARDFDVRLHKRPNPRIRRQPDDSQRILWSASDLQA